MFHVKLLLTLFHVKHRFDTDDIYRISFPQMTPELL